MLPGRAEPLGRYPDLYADHEGAAVPVVDLVPCELAEDGVHYAAVDSHQDRPFRRQREDRRGYRRFVQTRELSPDVSRCSYALSGLMKKFLYCLKWWRFHPQAFARFEELKRNECLSLDELMSKQETARQKIVRSAMEWSAFYRSFYGAVGFEAGDIGTEGWFERLPIVTKKELREHFDEFVAPQLRQHMKISTTGGSTGTPAKTGYDGRATEEIYSWRLQSWFDVGPWDDHAYVWRMTASNGLARIKNVMQWWPTRHVKLDATFISEEAIFDFLVKCRRVKPALVMGYVGALTQVAQYIADNNIELNGWRPKVVWATSAPLSPVQRNLLEHSFVAPVCDQYGSCEIRWIAQQCSESKGLHVNTEHVHIEFVDDRNMPVPRGEYGRTLLTNLEDEVFPLIRYENGDRGRWLLEPCACGRTLPCIDSVKGRESESFVLPSGKTINGEYLTTIFDATPDIVRGFRVVQHKDASITIEYIPSSSSSDNLVQISSVLTEFAAKLGGEVPIDFKSVNEIQHDRGKLRFVVREK